MKILAKPKFGIINRRNNILYQHIEKAGIEVRDFDTEFRLFSRYDIFHMHWPDRIMLGGHLSSIFRFLILFWFFIYLRLIGCKIVWTVHNPNFKHSRTLLSRRLFVLIIRHFVDGFIYTSAYSKKVLARGFKLNGSNASHCVVPLGLQTELIPENTKKLDIVRDINDYTLVFGRIASDRFAIESLRAYLNSSEEQTKLVLAGQIIDEEVYKKLLDFQKENPERVFVYTKRFSDFEVGCLIDYAGSVYIEHRGLNSGVATLAACYGKDVIFSRRKSAELFKRQYSYKRAFYLYENQIIPLREKGDIGIDQEPWDMEKVALETAHFYQFLADKNE